MGIKTIITNEQFERMAPNLTFNQAGVVGTRTSASRPQPCWIAVGRR
jgi:hypothetical protein